MKKANPVISGAFFGLSSGIITILGLMTGLGASTHSSQAVLGGIIIIAIADSLSDSFGMHISKESEHNSSDHDVWVITAATLGSKMLMTSTFILPVVLLPLDLAINASVAWGLLALTLLSVFIGHSQQRRIIPIVAEHIAMAILVVVLTHFIGSLIGTYFPEPPAG